MASGVKITNWSNDWQPAEAELRQAMQAEGLQPYRWSNSPGDTYLPHSHSYHKVIFVVDGSITFGLPQEGKSVQLRAGDRLDLPASVVHDAQIGAQGVVCLEAHAKGEQP